MIDTERDLFVRRLRELYDLERELEALQSRLATEATDEDLEAFFMSHSESTTAQLARLDDLFDAMEVADESTDRTDESNRAPPLAGLLEERDALLGDVTNPNLEDVVDAEVARAIERFEITRLETLLTLADRLDLPSEVSELLETTKIEAENGLESLQEQSVA